MLKVKRRGFELKKVINEIFFLRCVACLGIVLMHAVTSSIYTYEVHGSTLEFFLTSIQMILMFGTPIFVFISEFVLAHSYPEKTPKGFMKKRIKFILFPYMIMGMFYAGILSIYNNLTFNDFIERSIQNIFLGNYHGYFVIIIFQFYILHQLFQRIIVPKFSAKKVIIGSIVINILYLVTFNFIPIKDNLYFIPELNTVWRLFYKLPFAAWLGYFAVAYYCGSNYNLFLKFLKNNIKWITLSLIFTGFLLLVIFHSEFLDVTHSRRVDVFFYTFSVAFSLFYIGSKINKMPKFIVKISQYSFGIYLLHPFMQLISKTLVTKVTHLPISLYITVQFIAGVFGSILITYLLNKSYIGYYFVGKLGRSNETKNERKAS
jgi:membrane-bound acyltransferase YfiQ involved in biofilm formation